MWQDKLATTTTHAREREQAIMRSSRVVNTTTKHVTCDVIVVRLCVCNAIRVSVAMKRRKRMSRTREREEPEKKMLKKSNNNSNRYEG